MFSNFGYIFYFQLLIYCFNISLSYWKNLFLICVLYYYICFSYSLLFLYNYWFIICDLRMFVDQYKMVLEYCIEFVLPGLMRKSHFVFGFRNHVFNQYGIYFYIVKVFVSLCNFIITPYNFLGNTRWDLLSLSDILLSIFLGLFCLCVIFVINPLS